MTGDPPQNLSSFERSIFCLRAACQISWPEDGVGWCTADWTKAVLFSSLNDEDVVGWRTADWTETVLSSSRRLSWMTYSCLDRDRAVSVSRGWRFYHHLTVFKSTVREIPGSRLPITWLYVDEYLIRLAELASLSIIHPPRVLASIQLSEWSLESPFPQLNSLGIAPLRLRLPSKVTEDCTYRWTDKWLWKAFTEDLLLTIPSPWQKTQAAGSI